MAFNCISRITHGGQLETESVLRTNVCLNTTSIQNRICLLCQVIRTRTFHLPCLKRALERLG